MSTTLNMPPIHPEAEHKNLSCGACQWFSAGYGGVNCQKTRLVEVLTPACIEFQAPSQDPFAIFSRDKYIAGARQDLLKVKQSKIHEQWRMELSGYNLEIDNINFAAGQHAEVNSMKESLKTIIGYRFRVTEIMSTLILDETEIEKLEEKVYVWMISKYPEVREYKNEKLKQVALSRSIPELIDVKYEVSKTMKLAKFIDGKIDKNDSTLQKLLKAAESTYFSPNKI